MIVESSAGQRLFPPVVTIHGLDDARKVLGYGLPVTLLSGPGAAGVGGILWWRAVMLQARAEHPKVAVFDVLDCGSAPGLAMGALRCGQEVLVLDAAVPAFARVAAAAREMGSVLLPARPASLDLAVRGALPRLEAHLSGHAPS